MIIAFLNGISTPSPLHRVSIMLEAVSNLRGHRHVRLRLGTFFQRFTLCVLLQKANTLWMRTFRLENNNNLIVHYNNYIVP